jgi:hypothetical protein
MRREFSNEIVLLLFQVLALIVILIVMINVVSSGSSDIMLNLRVDFAHFVFSHKIFSFTIWFLRGNRLKSTQRFILAVILEN